jgi:transcriptional regulator with XRE-family HTH domain
MTPGNRVRIITFSGVIITLQPVIMRTAFYKHRFLMQFCNVIYNLKERFMADLTNAQKKEWAKTLYLKENLTQQEIADRVGVSRVSVSNWVRAGKWEEQKVGLTLTRQEQVANLYRQVAEINKAIAERPEGERFPSSKEADILGKLSAAIRNMEQEVGIADIISVLTGLIDWVRAADLEKAKEITRLADAYIKDKL